MAAAAGQQAQLATHGANRCEWGWCVPVQNGRRRWQNSSSPAIPVMNALAKTVDYPNFKYSIVKRPDQSALHLIVYGEGTGVVAKLVSTERMVPSADW